MHVDVFVAWVIWLVRMYASFSLVHIFVFLFVNPFCFSVCVSLFLFPFYFFFFKDFVGVSSANPHKTLLVHLGEPMGLKGLFHTLNATAIPAKVI